MAARAMDNFGLSKLSIVNPRDGWPSKKAENSAKKMIEVADDPEELIVNLKEIRVRKNVGKKEETKSNENKGLSDRPNNLNVDKELLKSIKKNKTEIE